MYELKFSHLREVNHSRLQKWHAANKWSLSDWGVATAGELGEALNIIKKLNRVRDDLQGNTETPDILKGMLANEIADTVIYLDLLAYAAGVDLAEAITNKFNATSVKHGFSERL